jgi:dihydroneopterin aldolase
LRGIAAARKSSCAARTGLSPARRSANRSRMLQPRDTLTLQVHDLEVDVLTGVYSEETHLPQPLRISLDVDLDMPERFAPDTPLDASKSYLDLKHAATNALPPGVHFTLIEAIAEHIAETLFLQDARVARVGIRIIKLAIAEAGESIGITMVRHRR